MRNKKRQIVLDTETTGLEWSKGNRIVEIGAVELLDRLPVGTNFIVISSLMCRLSPVPRR